MISAALCSESQVLNLLTRVGTSPGGPRPGRRREGAPVSETDLKTERVGVGCWVC